MINKWSVLWIVSKKSRLSHIAKFWYRDTAKFTQFSWSKTSLSSGFDHVIQWYLFARHIKRGQRNHPDGTDRLIKLSDDYIHLTWPNVEFHQKIHDASEVHANFVKFHSCMSCSDNQPHQLQVIKLASLPDRLLKFWCWHSGQIDLQNQHWFHTGRK